MTGLPAGVAEITGRISTIQAMIASLTAPPATTSPASSATAATSSATAFSKVLSAATGTTFSAQAAVKAQPSQTTSGTGAAAVDAAKSYLGVPYVWGGESRDGIDCSGLVQASFGSVGVHLPRTAAEQQKVGTPVASLADAQPGDLLFFGRPAHHVAIYLGDNKLIEAPQAGETVSIRDVYQTPTSISRVAPSAGNGPALASGVSSAVAAHAGEFAAAEAKYQLPSGLLSAVAQQESGGNTRAVSPDGAEGLMQLMPATAAAQGVDPMDPAQAIDAAGRILSGDLAEFGSVPLALAAYNAGAGAVKQYGGIPPFAETQDYVRRITSRLGLS